MHGEKETCAPFSKQRTGLNNALITIFTGTHSILLKTPLIANYSTMVFERGYL